MTDGERRGRRGDRGRLLAGALAGLLAAGVALGVAELVAAGVSPTSAPVVAFGGAVIDATPTPVKELAVRELGTKDKPVLVGSILLVLALLVAVTGALAVRRPRVGVLAVVAIGGLAALAAATRPTATWAAPLPSLVGALVGVLALVLMLRPLRSAGAARSARSARSERSAPGTGPDDGPVRARWDRRRFLVTGGSALTLAAVAAAVGRFVSGRRLDIAASRAGVELPKPASAASALPADADLRLSGLTPWRTDNASFYRVDTALVVPKVTAEAWRLRVHGSVRKEMELTFDDLLRRPLVERDITLACVSNEVGGRLAGNARWLGALLAPLLREAGVEDGADQILSRSVDGMTISTPVADVMDGRDAMLAVAMNGEPLPAKHGFPVRMVVPGLYGYVSATKWVVDLELTRFADQKAYWTERDWAEQAPVKTFSRIDVPRPLARVKAGRVAVAGIAWAQHRGISGVEVRVDGGPWRAARLAGAPSTDTWRQWSWAWDAAPGSHTLEVRATDGGGATQPQRRARPFPSGATGWHSSVVTVT